MGDNKTVLSDAHKNRLELLFDRLNHDKTDRSFSLRQIASHLDKMGEPGMSRVLIDHLSSIESVFKSLGGQE